MSTYAGAARFLAELFGPRTAAPVFVTSLANVHDDKQIAPRSVVTRELDVVEKFTAKWDQPGRALYFCVSTLRPGAPRRTRENVAELPGLHVDVDFKDVEAAPSEIEAALAQLPLQPQRINSSGHGLHCYWLFPKALPATPENIERVEAALKKLADVLAGDTTVCHVASLMRLPGSHNSKRGEWIEVTTVVAREGCYTIEELEAWLAIAAPVLRRRPSEKGNGHDQDDPWLALAKAQGFKRPIDVEQRLTDMQHRGPGDSAIHLTQLSVTASLLNGGVPVEEVVARVLEATQAAAGADGTSWDWAREERDIRAMCESWAGKHPEIVDRAPPRMAPTMVPIVVPTVTAVTTPALRIKTGADSASAGTGAGAAQAGATSTRKTKPGRSTIAMVIADGAIRAFRQSRP